MHSKYLKRGEKLRDNFEIDGKSEIYSQRLTFINDKVQ